MDSSLQTNNNIILSFTPKIILPIIVIVTLIPLLTVLTTLGLYFKYSIICDEGINFIEPIKVYKDIYFTKYTEKFYTIISNKDDLLTYSYICACEFIESHLSISL